MTQWTQLAAEKSALRVDPDGRISAAPDLAPDLVAEAWLKDRVNEPSHRLYTEGGAAVGIDARTVLLRYDMHTVTEDAHDTLLNLLAGERRDRAVLICGRFGAWVVEAAPTAQSAIAALEEAATLSAARPLLRTALQRLEPNAGAAESPRIAALLKDWRRFGRQSPPGSMPAFVETLPGGIVVSTDDGGSDMYVAHVGTQSAAAGSYDGGWRTQVLGQRIVAPVATPNHEARVCAAYSYVAAEQVPYYDHVLGCLDHTPAHHVWVRYRRLILPFEMDNGTPALFVFSELWRNAFPGFMKLP